MAHALVSGRGGDICTVGWTELIENASSADRESWVISVMAQFRQTDDGDDVIPFVKLLIEEQHTTIILNANCFAFDLTSGSVNYVYPTAIIPHCSPHGSIHVVEYS